MEIIVRDIDLIDMEERLPKAGFHEDPPERIVVVSAHGDCTLETDFRKVFWTFSGFGNHVKVHLGDPGELCLRIEGSSHLFLAALIALDIPTSGVQEMIQEIS